MKSYLINKYEFLKVFFHCLIKSHQQCVSINHTQYSVKHFCECGFNNNGISYEEHLEEIRKNF